ncbi:class I adenylate-forming enzyme family protein [Nakamurella lactea]|uniref:class I adenylate-forming enzyme family protein n=1 Tax=Nakamurella lactea TaxID=459515 RepID=UPI00041B3A4B|nr:fatty acid--CoA ligase family protein [Nakamurella lactea]
MNGTHGSGNWRPALRPGSIEPTRPAIQWTGQQLDYREFGARVRAAGHLDADDGPGAGGATGASGVVDASRLPVPEQLVAVFAAAATRRAVWLADPAQPIPTTAIGQSLPADAFLLVGTSGSSRAPRAVVRTLGSWTSSFAGYSALTGICADDRVLLTGPLFSTMQLFSAVHALAIGATVTDDPATATTAICVPTVLGRLLQLPTPALRSVVVAGAVLPESLARQAISMGLTVTEYYGAAELSFVTARRWPAPHAPFPGVTVRLRDGELWSRSDFRALGYLTATGLAPVQLDAEKFASVGDLATVDDAGGLQITGRGDAAVTVGGRTVIAEDVETTLGTLASVSDAAVLGLPHPRFGEQLIAVVVPAPGADLGIVRAAARLVLRGESLPRRWLQVDRIPRRPNGKIDRGDTRRLLQDRLADL